MGEKILVSNSVSGTSFELFSISVIFGILESGAYYRIGCPVSENTIKFPNFIVPAKYTVI
jgi:hypothetical protein